MLRGSVVRLVVLLLLSALLVVACSQAPAASPTQAPSSDQSGSGGTTSAPPTEAPAASTEEPFRVALVLPGKINDFAISQAVYEAMMALQEEMGEDKFQVVYSESMFNVDDAAAAMRDYASQGNDLIIAASSAYSSPIQEVAPDFPDVSFAWGTTVDTFGLPNVYSFATQSDEGGYVGGVMAALLTKSGKIGYVGPIETGSPQRTAQGFVAGVKATNPDVEVAVVWTGSFSDASLASAAAQTHIQNGADVMSGETEMSVGAVSVAKQNNIPWFGAQTNYAPLAPEVVYASSAYRLEALFRDMVAKIQAGTLGGEVFVANLANGGMVIEFNPDFPLPDEVKAAAEEAIQGIKDGTIDTGVAKLSGVGSD